MRQIILTDALPALQEQTRSARLKLAISKFLSENTANADQSAPRSA
jgi:hypothetical protein